MKDKQNILITGGAGYIGSHTLIELHNAGYSVWQSCEESLSRVSKIISKDIIFEQGDIRDKKSFWKIRYRFGYSFCSGWVCRKPIMTII